jgi:signal transduction histidine kinase
MIVSALALGWVFGLSGQTLGVVLVSSATTSALAVLLGYAIGTRFATPAPLPAAASPVGGDIRPLGTDAFLASLSHEWRTPLTAIIGYSELLQEDLSDLQQPELIPDLKRIQNAGQHLLGLVDDVVDLWKLQEGTMSVVVQQFTVPRLVEEVARTTGPLLDTTPHSLAMDVGAGLPPMRSDRVKLRRALVNLVRFACGLAGKGQMELSAHVMEDPPVRGDSQGVWIEFRLVHPGVQLAEPTIQAIVADLEHSSEVGLGEIKGPGLGPVIIVELCRLLGGTLDMRFDVQRGAVFAIRVPAETPDPFTSG